MFKKIILVFASLACLLAILKAADMPGGIRVLTGREFQLAVEKLKVALLRVEILGGPHYLVQKVIRATEQVTAGTITRYVTILHQLAEHKDRNCSVKILERDWAPKVTEVRICCEGLEKYVINYDP